ncbi:AAA family ATPase [Novosphingobium colocasiae]|uniref:AAA family ATPase n=1 Tax=Novosphingobium colocasiae TaxID=1256513 RepID=UPI0035B32FCA
MEVVAQNSPAEVEARAWLNGHKDGASLSWPQIARLTDVASSTLSAFAAGKYAGNNEGVAGKVLAYRDRLASQAALSADAPMMPDWFETPTSQKLTSLLRWAQSGEIVLIVTTPGIGKTRVAERFAAHDPNVWLATMSPSTSGVATMAIEVGEAIGLGEIKGSPQQLSRQIKARVRSKKGLLIIDEAQELTDKALNELRSWHDRTQVGIALMGNEATVGQIEGRKSALAQISSRFSIRHVQGAPMAGDMDALLDAWGIMEQEQRAFLVKVGRLPGALREMTHTIKIASLAAMGTGKPMTLAHLRDAARQRNAKIGTL